MPYKPKKAPNPKSPFALTCRRIELSDPLIRLQGSPEPETKSPAIAATKGE